MTDAPTTPLRAPISNGYRIRLALIGLGLTAFGFWAVYDGAIGYPKKAAVYAEFEAFQEEHDDYLSRWPAYAAERGYETNPNQVKPLEQKDIWTQWVMAGICLPIGGYFLFSFLRASGRTVEADETGVRGRDGAATWDEVHDLDDSRWRTKGISRVQYRRADGTEGKILLDDWKFEREPTVAIHDLVMKKLGKTPEGGTPEAPAEPAAATSNPAAEPAEAGPDQPLRP